MSIQTLKQFSETQLPHLETTMLDFINKSTTEAKLRESICYSLAAGGKRLRPLLVLATVDFLGEPLSQGHYAVAAALEMVHTYSLIHDDLPAMDNDELRRGKPTNHVVYGDALAILAGDGLLTAAFELLSEAELSAEVRIKLVGLLAQAAGSRGMVAGQVADIQGEGQDLDLASLQAIHQRKTGALIEFAVLAACQLAGASADVTRPLSRYAQEFGIAFQIKDDLLDVLGDEQSLGKKVGQDQLLAKATYPALLGLAGAEKALADHLLEAQHNLMLASKGLATEADVELSLLNQLLLTLVAN